MKSLFFVSFSIYLSPSNNTCRYECKKYLDCISTVSLKYDSYLQLYIVLIYENI